MIQMILHRCANSRAIGLIYTVARHKMSNGWTQELWLFTVGRWLAILILTSMSLYM